MDSFHLTSTGRSLLKKRFHISLPVSANVFSSAVSIVSSITGVVLHIVIAFIFAIYILAEKERLARQFNSLMEAYLKESIREKVMYVLITAHSVFTKFFVGQLVEAVILGFLCTVGMLIFRFPYATMIGTLIALRLSSL